MSKTPAEIVREIKKGRIDNSDYLIHFTKSKDQQTAYHILEQIAYNGYIKSGWSIREGKRTIFGPEPAVCFTEMPLWALELYALNRNKKHKIDCYGVALRKRELFKRGARNVIYGTSSLSEKETMLLNSDEMYNPGLPMNEQYRYMLTDIDWTNDWTHEREWRWTKRDAPEGLQVDQVEGLPLYVTSLNNSHDAFSEVILIVNSPEEKDKLKSTLNTSININSTKPSGVILSSSLIKRTKILVLEELNQIYQSLISIEQAIKDGHYHNV